MYLDEKLLQMEADQEKRKKHEKHVNEIKEELIRQEQEQKSVDDWISELRQKKVTIDLLSCLSVFLVPFPPASRRMRCSARYICSLVYSCSCSSLIFI